MKTPKNKKIAIAGGAAALLITGSFLANGLTGGALGGVITGTNNDFATAQAFNQFNQIQVTDMTGATTIGTAATSSVGGTATTQMSQVLPLFTAAAEAGAYVKLSNTGTLPVTYTFGVTAGVKDETGTPVNGAQATAALHAVTFAVSANSLATTDGAVLQSNKTLDILDGTKFPMQNTSSINYVVQPGQQMVIGIASSVDTTLDPAFNGWVIDGTITVESTS